MIPLLFKSDAVNFSTNGIGVLSDAIDCTVISRYELEMKYPVKGMYFDQLSQRSIILADVDPFTEKLQPFRIYRITKATGGAVTVYARHVANDLAGITVTPFSATGPASAMKNLATHATTEHPFLFSTDVESSELIEIAVPKDAWSIMGNSDGCMQALFGGEWEFDVWHVKLLQRLGADHNVTIRYGKNLTSLQQDENCANCVTAVHPYWTNSDGDVVQLPEVLVKADGDFGYTKIAVLDCSKVFDEAPSADALREYTKQYISDNNIGVPQISLKIEYVPLEQTDEYKDTVALEQILFGDTVHVYFDEIGISASARVTATRYKPLLGRYENVTLGSPLDDAAGIIASHQKQLKGKVWDSDVKHAINGQTAEQVFNRLTNGGKEQGIYRENGKIYINGTYIKAGTIWATLVRAGVIKSVDELTWLDLDTGEFVSKDVDGNQVRISSSILRLLDPKNTDRIYIGQDTKGSSVFLFSDDMSVWGGFAANDRLWLYAPDWDSDGAIIGRRCGWKEINGVKTLVEYQEDST